MKQKKYDAWYIFADENQYGPISSQTLENYIRFGAVKNTDYIWDYDANEWILFNDSEYFKELFAQLMKEPLTDFERKIIIPEVLILKGTKLFFRKFIESESETERMYKRISFFIPAEISKKNKNEYIPVKLENISAGGMAVETTGIVLEKDEIIDARIFINSLNKYVGVTGQTVRVNCLANHYYKYGIKFIDADFEEGKNLMDILSWRCSEYQTH